MFRVNRRIFLKFISTALMFVLLPFVRKSKGPVINTTIARKGNKKSSIFIAKNGSPEQNMVELIKMMGGIEKIIGKNDIVILKPNAQWWNQGTTNTNAIKAFIELVLSIQDFKGEVIIAENHHFPEDNSRGWTTEKRNGDFNLNELVDYFQQNGYRNVTKVHWHDGGKSTQPSWGGAENGGLVSGPADGDGYVWRPDIVHEAPHGRKVMMSYPVFTSPYSGRRIDFKDGVWENGKYADIPVKFINFSTLNHHEQTGVTASIKNYLGICDMTCGYRGVGPEGYWNLHSVGFSRLPGKIKRILRYFNWIDTAEYIGGAVGTYMKTIRKADLNIITAHTIGWGSRTDLKKQEKVKTLLASEDPVALDYYAAKYILLPATKKHHNSGRVLVWNDPDNPKSPFHKFLLDCYQQGVGNLEEELMQVNEIDAVSSNFSKKT